MSFNENDDPTKYEACVPPHRKIELNQPFSMLKPIESDTESYQQLATDLNLKPFSKSNIKYISNFCMIF